MNIRHQYLLVLVLILFVIIGSVFAVTTPLFEASDELWHYPMVWNIAQGNGLPVLNPNNPGPWRQEAGQPPLYYYMMALATSWIDTSDMHSVRWLNPHVDTGVVTMDGNVNMAIHPPNTNSWPYTGTELAMRLIRILSVIISTGTVYLTYRLALVIKPGHSLFAIGSASILAFTPMFVFISGSINNDNLAMLIASAIILIASNGHNIDKHKVKIEFTLRKNRYPIAGHISILHVLLGVLLGLGALTKLSLLTLFPIVGLSISYNKALHWWKDPNRKYFKAYISYALLLTFQLIVIYGAAIAISGWWFLRNLNLYGSITGINMFVEVLGERSHSAPLAQLWSERIGFMQSYWGLFGAVNVPLPQWVYATLNTLSIISIAGLIMLLVRKLKESGWQKNQWFPLALNVVFILVVVVSLIRWATDTWSSQGRLVFTAIQSITVLFTLGVYSIVPSNFNKVRPFIITSLSLFMCAITTITPSYIIAPAYTVQRASNLENLSISQSIDLSTKSGKPQIRLLGYTLPSSSVRPGETVELTLFWTSITNMNNDWSVFIHLQDPNDIIVAQRDTYPGIGLLPTSLMTPGITIEDNYVIPISNTVSAPTNLRLTVGLYNFQTGERLYQLGGEDHIYIDTLKLEAHPGSHPNPLSVNFQNNIELIGYDTNPQVITTGQNIHLTLYWLCKRDMQYDYTVFAQVRGDGNQVWGQHDSWPGAGFYPTTSCKPGDIIEDIHPIDIALNTPQGVYDLQIGLYDEAGARLQRINSDGRWTENYVSLNKIKVTIEQ